MLGPMTFRFLNETQQVDGRPWRADSRSHLWRYNLHYFDDLNALGAERRRLWHVEAINNWIHDNPPQPGDA
jgi:hypothetical protein